VGSDGNGLENIRVGKAHIFRYLQRVLLRQWQTEQKMTDIILFAHKHNKTLKKNEQDGQGRPTLQ